jgi:hypothetical protein
MAFKDDASFLRFVTMGALGAQRAAAALEAHGHRIVELERYCTSNKIWATKIKRLRVPDLLCIRCGRRFEIRAKTELAIRMSHSQGNPDRAWDAGMRDDDVIVFLRSETAPTAGAVCLNSFTVGDLRACQNLAKLGAPKSAGEGAERDLTWSAWVPGQDGYVEAIQGTQIKVLLANGRRQTYSAKGKAIYVPVGASFRGEEQIVAAVPACLAPLDCQGDTWMPSLEPTLSSGELFTSLKALAHRREPQLIQAITNICQHDDQRIRLEALAALERHHGGVGVPELSSILNRDADNAPWAMEAAFILEELATEASWAALEAGASTASHAEVRAVCIWALRRRTAGIEKIVAAFEDRDSDVAVHAIVAAGTHVAVDAMVARLIESLNGLERAAACAARALTIVGSPAVAALLRATQDNSPAAKWAFSSLVRIAPPTVRADASWTTSSPVIRASLEAAWFEPERSWLGKDVSAEIDLLQQQTL